VELSRGSWIGPYRIDALIARGGMGAVYRAARADGAPVALKILHARRTGTRSGAEAGPRRGHTIVWSTIGGATS
jgi:hypothetical protein